MIQQTKRLLVRRSRQGDIAAIERVFASAFRSQGHPYNAEQIEAALQAGIGRSPTEFAAGQGFVAELDNMIVGATAWSFSDHALPGEPDVDAPKMAPGEAVLRSVCVTGAAAGLGIGRRIVEAACSDAAASGARAIMLRSTAGALRFYLALGFVRVRTFETRLPGVSPLVVHFMRRGHPV
jgi:predicted N-acetyltransferase YhbS